MQRQNDQRQVLARYSYWKAPATLVPIFGVAVFFIFAWYLEWTDPDGFTRTYRSYALITGSGLCLIALPTIIRFLRRIAFDGGRAVWVEGEHLIYLDPKFLKVACANVTEVFTTVDYAQTSLNLKLKDGRTKTVPTGLLSSPPLIILERVKQACSLA